jgi:hypothetical protein
MVMTGVQIVSAGNRILAQDTGRTETMPINRKSDTTSVVFRLMSEIKCSVRLADFINLTASLTILLPTTLVTYGPSNSGT